MPEIKVDDTVKYGFRTGRVIRLERRHGIDGAVVTALVRDVGDGAAPHWVPLSQLTREVPDAHR